MPSVIVDAMAKKLDIPELLELQKSFGKIAAKSYPVTPQLSGRSPQEPQTESSANSPFKI